MDLILLDQVAFSICLGLATYQAVKGNATPAGLWTASAAIWGTSIFMQLFKLYH